MKFSEYLREYKWDIFGYGLMLAGLIMLGSMGGCSVLNGPATNQQLLANTTLKFAVIKKVESSKNPAQLAAKVRSVLNDVKVAINDPNASSLTLDGLDAKVKIIIGQKISDPADKLLADTVRQIIHDDLQNRLKSSGIDTSGLLTPEVIGAIKVVIQDIEDGLTLSGV